MPLDLDVFLHQKYTPLSMWAPRSLLPAERCGGVSWPGTSCSAVHSFAQAAGGSLESGANLVRR